MKQSKFFIRLKELRKENKISQMELAKRTGLTQPSLARWEKQKSYPTSEDLCILSEYFNVSVDYLLGLSDY